MRELRIRALGDSHQFGRATVALQHADHVPMRSAPLNEKNA
jgi:hypothetical protein